MNRCERSEEYSVFHKFRATQLDDYFWVTFETSTIFWGIWVSSKKLIRQKQFTPFKFIKHTVVVYGVYGAVDFKTKQELTFVILWIKYKKTNK